MCDQQSLRSACAYAQSDQSLCWLLEYSMSVKLLTEHHLEFLSVKGDCTGSSESTLVKMPHCWKSHVTAQFIFFYYKIMIIINLFCNCAVAGPGYKAVTSANTADRAPITRQTRNRLTLTTVVPTKSDSDVILN